jgi:predicted PolB exonuclease-like 3'-5' exonuclease
MSAIIVDVETYPLDDVEQYLTPLPEIPPPNLDAIQPAKNLVDPVKVAADLEKRKAAALKDYDDALIAQHAKRQAQIDGASLDPDLGRIVAIGWQVWGEPTVQVRVCRDTGDEAHDLEMFWRDYRALRDPQLVTFSGLRFDLPYLMRRSLYLGVKCPKLVIDRYRTNHLDLQAVLSYNGVLTWRSLKFYMARFGIPDDDPTTGKDIVGMVRAGDWDGVAAHCAADVRGTAALAQRLGLIEAPRQVQAPIAEGAF